MSLFNDTKDVLSTIVEPLIKLRDYVREMETIRKRPSVLETDEKYARMGRAVGFASFSIYFPYFIFILLNNFIRNIDHPQTREMKLFEPLVEAAYALSLFISVLALLLLLLPLKKHIPRFNLLGKKILYLASSFLFLPTVTLFVYLLAGSLIVPFFKWIDLRDVHCVKCTLDFYLLGSLLIYIWTGYSNYQFGSVLFASSFTNTKSRWRWYFVFWGFVFFFFPLFIGILLKRAQLIQ